MKVLGVCEDRTTCDCCGRTGLKRTVALENEEGDILYYGTTCAASAVLGRRSAGEVILERARINEAVIEAYRGGGRDQARRVASRFGVAYRLGVVNGAGKCRIKAPWDEDWQVVDIVDRTSTMQQETFPLDHMVSRSLVYPDYSGRMTLTITELGKTPDEAVCFIAYAGITRSDWPNCVRRAVERGGFEHTVFERAMETLDDATLIDWVENNLGRPHWDWVGLHEQCVAREGSVPDAAGEPCP